MEKDNQDRYGKGYDSGPVYDDEYYGEKKPCSGCLNNGICDPGECMDCPDCMGGKPGPGGFIIVGTRFP